MGSWQLDAWAGCNFNLPTVGWSVWTWLTATVSFSSVTNVTTVQPPAAWLLLLRLLYVEPSVFFAVVTKHGQAGENGGKVLARALLTWLRNELGLRREWGGKHFSGGTTHQPAVSAVSLWSKHFLCEAWPNTHISSALPFTTLALRNVAPLNI